MVIHSATYFTEITHRPPINYPPDGPFGMPVGSSFTTFDLE